MDREIVIKNASGLHARPAAKFVVFAKGLAQPVTISKGEKSALATSLIGVLSLGIIQGDRIRLTAEGENAGPVLEQFAEFIDQLAYEQ